MSEIVMPKLSDTMTEGRLVAWKKRVGEAVRRGEVLAEVETDKANMELESFVSGELLEIRVQEGEMVQVGTVIAVVGKAEEKGGGARQQAPPPEGQPEAPPRQGEAPPPEKPEAVPPQRALEEPKQAEEPKRAEEPEAATEVQPQAASADQPARAGDVVPMKGEKQAPAAPPEPGADEGQPASQPAEPYRPEMPEPEQQPATAAAPKAGPAEAEAGRERAAPVVRRRARELGIDLGQLRGSGPEGRILLQDLEQFEKESGQPPQQAQPEQPAQPAARPPGPQLVKGVSPMPRLRGAIAKTVAESWDKIPHFTVTMDIVMDDAEAMRRQLKQSGMPVSVNDVIVKAVALALQKFPQMNASYAAEGIQFHDEINVSIAVGVPDGVLMPVLKGCQQRSLLEISQEGGRLVDRARSGSLGETEMSGGTFSVSNLGMFGVSSFSAIIHPSQCAVLAVGAVTDTPVTCSGVLGSAKVMKVTLSADHRVVDGAYAAQFLAQLKEVLQNPVRLLI